MFTHEDIGSVSIVREGTFTRVREGTFTHVREVELDRIFISCSLPFVPTDWTGYSARVHLGEFHCWLLHLVLWN